MKNRRALVWFKNDLRLHDHEALYQACVENELVIPIYIVDPRDYDVTHLAFSKTGSHRAAFLFETLESLQHDLQERDADLCIIVGKPEDVIPAIVKDLTIGAVYAAREVVYDEQNVQARVEANLRTLGCSLKLFFQNTLYHIDDIPWPIQRLPDVFTSFRKELENEATVRGAIPAPSNIPYQPLLKTHDIPTLNAFALPNPIRDRRAALLFKGGEREALARLHYYTFDRKLISHYKETRNELLGGDYSSKLSPWLANGSLSPRTVYETVKRYEHEHGSNESTYWLIFELLWRDYFRFVAKKYGGKIFTPGGLRSKRRSFLQDKNVFDTWRVGKTGVDFVDANMRELHLTGYMSNRGRQNVASYLIHDLQIDWTWGATWFEHALIDYDASSNWLNWAYIAGVGNDPRPVRRFNIESQERIYDPQKKYSSFWLTSST